MKSALLILTMLVSGHLVAQDLAFTTIGPASLKRGMKYNISWTGGKAGEQVNLRIIDSRGKKITLAMVENSGNAMIEIPSRVKPGRSRLTITSPSGSIAQSPEILIRRRIPLAVQVGALLIIPPVTAFIIFYQPKEEVIMDAPSPPEPE